MQSSQISTCFKKDISYFFTDVQIILCINITLGI